MHVQMGAIISDMRLWLYARTTCTYERKSVLGGGHRSSEYFNKIYWRNAQAGLAI